MRVLYISNRFPGVSTRGDQLRAYQQIRHLSQRHAITLLSFGLPEGDPRVSAELQTCCERVVVAPRRRLGMLLRGMQGWLSGQALQVAAFTAVPSSAGLERLVGEGNFDLAHVQLARLAPMLQRLAPLPCVYDLVDALSLNMTRRGQLDRSPLGLLAHREGHLLAGVERQLCAQAAGVAVCSADDRAAIGDPRLTLVANGVDLKAFPFVAADDARSGIVFVGNLGYFPNVDAAAWLAEQVMPRLAARGRAEHLRLVGARPAARLVQIARRHSNVHLIGSVPDVHPYLAQAAVAVVPMRAGSGQQLKLLEAMAAGTPVVSTSAPAAAVNAVHDEHLLIADDAEATADAIERLLCDAALRRRLAAAARDLIERNFSWDASARVLEGLWTSACA